MKRIPLYITTILLTAAFTGCSQQEDFGNDNTNKELVLLTTGISWDNAVTTSRANVGKKIAFNKTGTQMDLYASAKWKGHGTNDTVTIKSTATLGDTKSTSGDNGYNYNELTSGLFWDDFGAGDLKNCQTANDLATTPIANKGMTVYGIAVDGYSIPARFSNPTNITAVADSVAEDLSGGIEKEDVVISNNINNENRYKYVRRSTTSRELEFKHIYNKITLKFKRGNGFTAALSTPDSVILPNYVRKGTLDVTTGAYSDTKTGAIKKLAKITAEETGIDHIYQALTLPGRKFTSDGTDEALRFIFNGNTYKVTSAEIYAALLNNSENAYATMKSGIHYVFIITVNKAKVELTATITDWTTVYGDLAPSNGTAATFSTSGDKISNEFNLYYSATTKNNTAANDSTSKTGYGTAVGFKWYETSPAHYGYADANNTIYWPNNATYYHFRALANATMITDAANGDYVTLTTKQTTKTSDTTDAYADVIWGAPYTNGTPPVISPALGPTSNAIHLSFFHKMAEVSFIIQTKAGLEKVDLSEPPTIVLKCISSGKVKMQDGSVTADTTNVDLKLVKTKTTNDDAIVKTQEYENIGVVPQSTEKKTLKITTKDGNTYEIKDLSKIKVTGTDNLISAWTSGKKYVYTITLIKSEVNITAQIKEWTTVTAADEEIKIQ